MEFQNRSSKMVNQASKLPKPLRSSALSFGIGSVVKFLGTAGIKIEELTYDKAVFSLKNRTKVQNHIGGIHAAAMVLLAESASGLLVNMNVPDTRVPVIKTLKVDFEKRTQGNMVAVATLTPKQIEEIRNTEKGETLVEVHVTDESGREPIQCEMLWAWTPKHREKNESSSSQTSSQGES